MYSISVNLVRHAHLLYKSPPVGQVGKIVGVFFLAVAGLGGLTVMIALGARRFVFGNEPLKEDLVVRRVSAPIIHKSPVLIEKKVEPISQPKVEEPASVIPRRKRCNLSCCSKGRITFLGKMIGLVGVAAIVGLGVYLYIRRNSEPEPDIKIIGYDVCVIQCNTLFYNLDKFGPIATPCLCQANYENGTIISKQYEFDQNPKIITQYAHKGNIVWQTMETFILQNRLKGPNNPVAGYLPDSVSSKGILSRFGLDWFSGE